LKLIISDISQTAFRYADYKRRACSRPVGYMKTPIIRFSLVVGSAHFRELQLPAELTGKGFAWPVLIKQNCRFFMPMAGAAHWFHKKC
jgi:hypothetical protein